MPSFAVNPGGTFNVINLPLAFLVETAFKIRRDRIVGAPAWFDSQLFQIRARGTWGAERPTAEQVNVLLRQVLEERFAFVSHQSERSTDVMALKVVRSDGRFGRGLRRSAQQQCNKPLRTSAGLPALRPDGFPDCGVIKQAAQGVLQVRGGSVSIAHFLSATNADKELGRPVFDRTGITALVDVELHYVPADVVGPEGQSFVGGVEDQLGLKFERAQERVPVLVIDRLQRPSTN